MDAENILDVPMYSPTLTARLVGLSAGRVRRWLRGYAYTYVPDGEGPARRHQQPIVARYGAAGSPFASFLDLIDLLFVKRFIEQGISIQRLRQALGEANEVLGAHHFAQQRFWTDGHEIYLELQDQQPDTVVALLHLLADGQWAIAPVVKNEAKQIDFNEVTGFAERWFPLGKEEPVVVDPKYSFGSPSVVSHAVETSNVFDLYKAEGRDVQRVCDWMDLDRREVDAAVRFEEMLVSAA